MTISPQTQDTLKDYGVTALRVTLGVAAMAHGLMKVGNLEGTVAFFGSLGLPAISAYAVTALEVIGGIALVVGFQTRLVALSMVPVLVGALWVHAGNGWLFAAPNGGWEYPAFWTMALIAQALLGNGAFALSSDHQQQSDAYQAQASL